MNKFLYYANLIFVAPFLFMVILMINLYKMNKQAIRFTMSQFRDDYKAARRYYKQDCN